MPLTTIHVKKGRPAAAKRAMADAVHAALIASLGIPETDRFQVIREYEPEDFIHSDGHLGMSYTKDLIMVEIAFLAGRDDAKKKALHAEINKRFVESLGISPDDLFVMFFEVGPASNVSFGRGIAQLAK
jgi:phenylpyruvate tautomerase PptA (4-oxalocrotonate tautomerase family)